MKKEWLSVYDLNSQDTMLVQMNHTDFESIDDFICLSGILDIGTKYAEINFNPDLKRDSNGIIQVDEIAVMNSGGGSLKYVIETTKRKLSLPIYGAYHYELPYLVREFNLLFTRYAHKYSVKNN
jgi:hypothetical protein